MALQTTAVIITDLRGLWSEFCSLELTQVVILAQCLAHRKDSKKCQRSGLHSASWRSIKCDLSVRLCQGFRVKPREEAGAKAWQGQNHDPAAPFPLLLAEGQSRPFLPVSHTSITLIIRSVNILPKCSPQFFLTFQLLQCYY